MGAESSANSLWLVSEQAHIVGSHHRGTLQRHQVAYPSYLHYDPQIGKITYAAQAEQSTLFLKINRLQPHHPLKVTFTRHPQFASTPLWRQVPQQHRVQLKEGDVVRLGTLKLLVRELVVVAGQSRRQLGTFSSPHSYLENPSALTSRINMEGSLANLSQVMSANLSEGMHSLNQLQSYNSKMVPSCRICFSSSCRIGDPLLNACGCAGSLRYVHVNCLRAWVSSKVKRIETSHCIYFKYEPFQCELCRATLSNELTHEGMPYILFQAQAMHPPYLRLEGVLEGKVAELMVRLQEGINLGVGCVSSNEIMLRDPSVERRHCELSYSKKCLWLGKLEGNVQIQVGGGKEVELGMGEEMNLRIEGSLFLLERGQLEKCIGVSTESITCIFQ